MTYGKVLTLVETFSTSSIYHLLSKRKLKNSKRFDEMKFTFWAFGILAICALSLFMVPTLLAMGQGQWASNYFNLGVVIASMFLVYMFAKLLIGRR
jgi:hypothetical protein